MPNPWFRFYSETLRDRKMERLARVTGQSKALIVGVWATLLSLANDSPTPGVLLLTEDIPLMLDDFILETGVESKLLDGILEAFIEMRMLTLADGVCRITNWDKRQFKSDSSVERVRAHRERKATRGNDRNDDETLHSSYRNAPDTDTDTDTEAEKIQTLGADAPTPPDCFPELFTASIKDIQAHAFTKSQWQQIIEAERAANGRKTLIKWIEAKLGGAGHPAIQAYREEMGNSPRANQYADIIDAIGDNGDFGLWRSVVSAWRLHGWNPYNIAGMLDAYRAGGVKNKNDGDSPTHRRGASKNPTGLEAFDEFERLMGKAEVIDVSE
ncbi:MAG: phage replisome organizer N-terminal domain-containing protein [Dehalococcoidia bacterium]|jgi:hypothetical protein